LLLSVGIDRLAAMVLFAVSESDIASGVGFAIQGDCVGITVDFEHEAAEIFRVHMVIDSQF
jgi:hypothetical protein